MRPLSRFLSVFLALILIGLSLVTVSANDKGLLGNTDTHEDGSVDHSHDPDGEDDDAATTGDNDTSRPTYGAKVIISRTDAKSPVYPGDKIKFRVLVVRGNHDIPGQAPADVSTSATEAGTFLVRTGDEGIAEVQSAETVTMRTDYIIGSDFPEHDDARTSDATDPDADVNSDKTKDLVAARPTFSKEIEYTVRTSDLGENSAERTVGITFTLVFDPDAAGSTDTAGAGDDNHAQAHVKSNSVPVLVMKKPGASAGASGVTIEFAGADPAEIEVGKKIKFTLTAMAKARALTSSKLVEIMRQRYSDADTKDGDPLTVDFLTIPTLQTQATSEEKSVEYVLRQEDLDAYKVVFSVKVEIKQADISGSAIAGWTKDTLTGSHTFMSMPPMPEEPDPNIIGMKEGVATVTRGAGDRVDIEFADGSTPVTLLAGRVAIGGITRTYLGYIRDSEYGQTYAVVVREADDKIVRIWISSDDPRVGDVPWASVNANYTVSAEVVNLIPLDEMYPTNRQLVNAGGHWYVYLGGKWRHIPDVPTFQSRNYFYCDLTTADASFLDRVMEGPALPSSGTSEIAGYPTCRNM